MIIKAYVFREINKILFNNNTGAQLYNTTIIQYNNYTIQQSKISS